MKVKLYTGDFGFVHEGWMPFFKFGQPQVIIWGDRHFKYHRDGVYLETFAYHLVFIPDPRQSTLSLAEG